MTRTARRSRVAIAERTGRFLRKNRQSSIRRRFHVLDHVIADKFTRANWTKDANAVDFPLTWNEALAYVADMCEHRVYGHDNWQLPSRDLLFSLISHQEINPALPTGHPFVNVKDVYWSSTTSVYEPRYAWTLYSREGFVGVGFKLRGGFYA